MARIKQIKLPNNETVYDVYDAAAAHNLVDGSAEGSLRGINSKTEDENYKLGKNAVAVGDNTKASAEGAYAEGKETIASSEYQHVQGKYNIEDADNTYVHIVGNGDLSDRSNALTIDWNGNVWYSGDVYVGSTSGKYKDEGSKKLITAEDVLSMELITVEDIDTICGASIYAASEVKY